MNLISNKLSNQYRAFCQRWAKVTVRAVGSVALVAVLAFNSSNALADDYVAGLDAFIDKKYERAKSHWLKAADANHVRSMFNLGLLHEQRKIRNARPEEAKRWYLRAADHGYLPANYQLALYLEQQGASRGEVRNMLAIAADGGYEPAKARLATFDRKEYRPRSSSTPVAIDKTAPVQTQNRPSANPDAIAVPERPRAGNSIISNSNYLSEGWLRARTPGDWTIQILAFANEAKVQSFIEVHGLQQTAAYFLDRSNGDNLYKLVYGSYSSKEQADFARRNLPVSLNEHGPWLRSMASVQAIIATP